MMPTFMPRIDMVILFGVIPSIIYLALRWYQWKYIKKQERIRDEKWSRGQNL